MDSSTNERYWGSVLFFKHLILLALLLMILIPTCLSIFLGVLAYRQSAIISSLYTELSASQVVDPLVENITLSTKETSTDDSTEHSDFLLPDETQALELEVPSYQLLYPDLYDTLPATQISAESPTLYLTFDDGPSQVTLDILAVLEEKDVKGTFFVLGSALESEEGQAILKQISDAGHTIGVHTYTHDYDTVYASVDAFLEDFYLTWDKIIEITGVAPSIFRFPGGSINIYNANISQEIISEMLRRGFIYFDWNASADDAITSISSPVPSIVEAATSTLGYSRVVLLMHDSYAKGTTAEALPTIIDYYLEAGYDIAPLSNEIKPIVYNYLY